MVAKPILEDQRDNRRAVIEEAFREAGCVPCIATVLYVAILLGEYIRGVAHTETTSGNLVLVVSVPNDELALPDSTPMHLEPARRAIYMRNFQAAHGTGFYRAASDLHGHSVMKIDITRLSLVA